MLLKFTHDFKTISNILLKILRLILKIYNNLKKISKNI